MWVVLPAKIFPLCRKEFRVAWVSEVHLEAGSLGTDVVRSFFILAKNYGSK